MPAELAGDDRHDRRDRERLEGDERDRQDETDRQGAAIRATRGRRRRRRTGMHAVRMAGRRRMRLGGVSRRRSTFVGRPGTACDAGRPRSASHAPGRSPAGARSRHRPVEPVEARAGRRPSTGGASRPVDGGAGRHGLDRPSRSAPRTPRPSRREHAAGQDDVGVAGAARWSRRMIAIGHRRELVGQPVDDRAGDAVPAGSGREDDRRQLPDAAMRESCRPRSRWVTSIGRAQPEVRRDESLEAGPRAPAVTRPDRGAERRQADVAAAAPVARDGAERGQPGRPAVRARCPPRSPRRRR